jgi:hypothetical protein
MTILTYNFTTVIFPLGLFIPVLLLVVFAVSLALARVYTGYRQSIGAGLAVTGVLEILPFILFSLGLNDVIHVIPLAFVAIIFIVGCITLIGGVVIFFLPKPPLKENI